MPSSGGKPAGKMKASTAKRHKQLRVAICSRYPSGEDIFPDEENYPTDTDALMFNPHDLETDLPEKAMDYLQRIITSNTAAIVDELVGPLGPVFLVRHDNDKRPRLLNFMSSNICVPGTSYAMTASRLPLKGFLRTLAGHYPAPDSFFSDSDYSVPSNSSEEDELSSPVKPRKVPNIPTILPPTKNVLQELRSDAISLGPPVEPPPSSSFPVVLMPAPSGDEMELEPTPTPAPTATATKQAQPRRPRFRYKNIDFSALAVPMPDTPSTVTVLFRPVNQADDLAKTHPKKLCLDLKMLGNYLGLRDIRNGGLAVDYPAGTATANLLATKELAGIQVTASLPADFNTSAAVLSGVSPLLTTEEILEELQTQPPAKILEIKRLAKPGQETWTVKITFEGKVLPERGFLFGRSRRFRAYVDKPLQCGNCGRFGHTSRVCRSGQRCWHCSLEHPTGDCPNLASPDCGNCGGAHAADSPLCPTRLFQSKICAVRAASGVQHRTARIAVTKAAKTYAEATKASKPSKQPRPAKEPTGPLFLPNVAHHRPPAPQGPADHATLAALFKGLLTILTTAAHSGNFAEALGAVSRLFLSQAPGADPGLFAI